MLRQFDAGDVVDSPAALLYQGNDFLKPIQACVPKFLCRTRQQTARGHSKHDSIEEWLVFPVEWAVDKYVALVIGISLRSGPTQVS